MSTKSPILEVEGVSKKFCLNLRRSLLYGATDLLSELAGQKPQRERLRTAEFWALKNVSFSLGRGETLGLIGSNGSGKSTLLRLISGIYPPDGGRIVIRGKVGALIALGAGFHPHMTGLENVYTNGTILGMSRSEINSKLKEIIEFAELGPHINSPVSTYSSGMTARLGFSVAVHSHPDLLIVDEVLAVGDLAFALKCHRKMADYRQNGGTTIMVSHSNQLIRNVCKKVIWINKGEVKAAGDVQDVCSLYEAEVMRGVGKSEGQPIMNYDPDVKITRVEILDADRNPKTEFKYGEMLRVRISLDCKRPVKNPMFTVSIHNAENILVTSNYSNFDGWKKDSVSGQLSMEFIIDRLTLNQSKYFLTMTFMENDIARNLEWHEKAYSFSVIQGPVIYGVYNPEPIWEFQELT